MKRWPTCRVRLTSKYKKVIYAVKHGVQVIVDLARLKRVSENGSYSSIA